MNPRFNKTISLLMGALLLCALFAFAPPARAAAGNNDEIAAAIYAQTAVGTDTGWPKYVKETFATETGITSATSGDSITWATVPASGVSAPWDGSMLDISAAQPTHTPGAAELVYETVTSGTVSTTTYTQYTPAATPGDPDIATTQLVVATNSALPNVSDYHVYTAEALTYVMDTFSRNKYTGTGGGTVWLENDIDLNGQYHYWPGALMREGQRFYGQNHTIYNLCAVDDKLSAYINGEAKQCGFILAMDVGAEFKDVSFDTAYIVGDPSGTAEDGANGCGVIGFAFKGPKISNAHVNNITVVGTHQTGSLVGRIQNYSTFTGTQLSNCSAVDCTVYGINHEGSLTGSVIGTAASYIDINRCYSVGCVVLSTGAHSGGLFSCGDYFHISNCFSNIKLYGTNQTGAFMGTNGNGTIDNCYVSGFLEGNKTIGGFVGSIDSGCSVAISNCYSTAITGISKGGQQMGGFVGLVHNVPNTTSLINCYAAGEVGYVDTVVTPGASGTKQPQECGGFVGGITSTGRQNARFSECYYDKQTTAMREWGVGTVHDLAGITGVLTTKTDKSGNGLLTQDLSQSTSGFQGFGGTAWNYSAKDHYPELEAFRIATAAEWGSNETAALVRAYSLSSTSTVILDTWEYGLNTATGQFTAPLADTTYCTVRDLTSGFSLSSDQVVRWDRIATQDNKGTGEAKSDIAGVSYDVLSLKTQNGAWLCDELVPGIEWLKVTCDDTGKAATRRLRVIPTAGLDAGESAVITGLYDHADDVELYFSTGSRLTQSTPDITTGIYPDKDGASNAITARQTQLINGVDSVSNDLFRNADAAYMSTALTDNARNGKLYVYAYPVTGFDATTNQIQTGALLDFATNDYAAKFNGYSAFENADERFLVTYMWVLNDGRVIQDAKLVRRAMMPFHVDLNLYKNSVAPANLYASGGWLYTGINSAGTTSPVLTDFSGFETSDKIRATASGNAEFKEHAQTAWKLTNTADALESVTVTISLSATESYSVTLSSADIVAGKNVPVPCMERRIVYRDGEYYNIPETVIREYTLRQDAASGVWYLNFEMVDVHKTSSEGYVFKLNDVENNIRVDVVALSPFADTGSLRVSKTVAGSGADFNKGFSFRVVLSDSSINGAYGGMTFTGGEASFALKHGESALATGIPVGTTYTVTESANDGYNTTSTGATGTIAKDTTAAAAFTNTRNPAVPAPNLVTTKTADRRTLVPGAVVTYTITLTNTGNADATGVRVRDYIPKYTSFVAGSITGGGVYGVINGREHVTWNFAAVSPGQVLTLSFKVKIFDCLPDNASIYNTALYDDNGNTHTNDPRDPVNKTNSVIVSRNPNTGLK